MDMFRSTFSMFIIIGYLGKVETLKCYTCSTLDPQVCKLQQQRDEFQKECGPRTTCVTMTYKQMTGGEEVTRFIKKCGTPYSQRCDDSCSNVEHLVPKSCKTSCCTSNLCNEEVNTTVIWYALIGKPNPNSSQQVQFNGLLWLLISLISSIYFV
ncbi:uncharacterized protein [Clytia hemisphaerica]|uniref:Uncharacterized protein n=1 Tax=Clytia hemisphaerica TaxID=252671 RepID=A0A7M5WJI4_9CNID|eukprot:TCONS_00002324-protein